MGINVFLSLVLTVSKITFSLSAANSNRHTHFFCLKKSSFQFHSDLAIKSTILSFFIVKKLKTDENALLFTLTLLYELMQIIQ